MKPYPSGVLYDYTDFVFSHELSFVTKFLHEYAELEGIYFGDQSVKINYTLECGQHVTDTINLVSFLEWVEELQ